MSLQTEIEDLDATLARMGASLDQMLAAAGVNRSTWTRWKNGSVKGARYDTMEKVRAAAAAAMAQASPQTTSEPDKAPSQGRAAA
jgi:transcriptional regulator with XRE-family HTH domain